MSKLHIGWAQVSITPEKKISLAGQFAERISEYVEKPLTATAMAVEACGDQMVLVSTDLAATAVNLVLDILFTGVFGWEVAGAAWATIIGQAVSFLFSLFYL